MNKPPPHFSPMPNASMHKEGGGVIVGFYGIRAHKLKPIKTVATASKLAICTIVCLTLLISRVLPINWSIKLDPFSHDDLYPLYLHAKKGSHKGQCWNAIYLVKLYECALGSKAREHQQTQVV